MTEVAGELPSEMVIEGTLSGDARLEGGCAWIAAKGRRYQVVFLTDHQIVFDPLQLRTGSGEVLAQKGDRLRLRGHIDQGVMTTCQVGTVFSANAVERL